MPKALLLFTIASLVACSAVAKKMPADDGSDTAVLEVRGETNIIEIIDSDLTLDTPGDDTALDTEVIAPPTNYHPLFDFVGTIELVEQTQEDGSFSHSQPRVFLADEVYPISHFLVEEGGDCQFYQALLLPPACTPECEPFTQWCHPEGDCRNWGQRHSAGPVTFDGLLVDLVATPDDTAFYSFGTSVGDVKLFEADSNISISAPGDELPPFAIKLDGLSSLAVKWVDNLELVDGADNLVEWVPSDSEATVEMAIQTGWHGSPSIATIWCSAPDSQGHFTIPQHMVEMYPPEDGGLGLEQYLSFIRRVDRKMLVTQFGPVQVFTGSQYTFHIRH